MSVGKIASYKTHIPPVALATGLGLGFAIWAVDDMQRCIDGAYKTKSDADKDLSERVAIVKKDLSRRASMVYGGLIATFALAFFELVFRHPGFGMLMVASSVISIVQMFRIIDAVQKNSEGLDCETKVIRAVEYVILVAIPAIAFALLIPRECFQKCLRQY